MPSHAMPHVSASQLHVMHVAVRSIVAVCFLGTAPHAQAVGPCRTRHTSGPASIISHFASYSVHLWQASLEFVRCGLDCSSRTHFIMNIHTNFE